MCCKTRRNQSRCLFILPSSRNVQLGHHVTFFLQWELTHFLCSVLVTSDPVPEPYLSCSPEDNLDELLRDSFYPEAKTGQECSGSYFPCSWNPCIAVLKGSRIFWLNFFSLPEFTQVFVYLFCRAHFGGMVGVKGVPDQKHNFWFMKSRRMGSIRVISAAGLWEAHGPFQVFHILGEDYKRGFWCLLITNLSAFPRCTNI